ncbi:MAG: REP-associated tyrosine transposase [Candidatus Cyclobacteriaceae bacterium M2_1C_046]
MSVKYKFQDQAKLYFVTFAVVEWVDVFSRRIYRDIFIESLKFCQERKGLEIYSWCLMTNHVHMIIGTTDQPMQFIIRDLKKYTSSRIIREIQNNPQESRKKWMLSIFKNAGLKNPNNTIYQFWRQDNHPIELTTNEMIDQKLDYIHNNPVEAGIVHSPEEYLYSSAKNYAGLGEYLIEVNFID